MATPFVAVCETDVVMTPSVPKSMAVGASFTFVTSTVMSWVKLRPPLSVATAVKEFGPGTALLKTVAKGALASVAKSTPFRRNWTWVTAP